MCKEVEHKLSCITISLLGDPPTSRRAESSPSCRSLGAQRTRATTGASRKAKEHHCLPATWEGQSCHKSPGTRCCACPRHGEAGPIPGSSGGCPEPVRQQQPSQPDNLGTATCEITAQGFPTSTSTEEGLSTKTNTFHLWLLPVLGA